MKKEQTHTFELRKTAAIKEERPLAVNKIFIEKRHAQQLYELRRHGFFEQTLLPENTVQIDIENKIYNEAIREIEEQVALEKIFWMQTYVNEKLAREQALSVLQRKFYWSSFSFPEKLKRHIQHLFGSASTQDVGQLFTQRLLELLTEKYVSRFLSTDSTGTTGPVLGSPLELQSGLVSTAYHYMVYQSESLIHYFETNMQYLEEEFGSDLTKEDIVSHFELNPFLEDAEYQSLIAKMIEDFHENSSTPPGLTQEEIDNLPSSSGHVYDEPIPTPTEEDRRLLRRSGNGGDLEDFEKQLDEVHKEKKRLDEKKKYVEERYKQVREYSKNLKQKVRRINQTSLMMAKIRPNIAWKKIDKERIDKAILYAIKLYKNYNNLYTLIPSFSILKKLLLFMTNFFYFLRIYVLRIQILIISCFFLTPFYFVFVLFVIFDHNCQIYDSFIHLFSQRVVLFSVYSSLFLFLLLNAPFLGEKIQFYLGKSFIDRRLPGKLKGAPPLVLFMFTIVLICYVDTLSLHFRILDYNSISDYH